MAELDTSQKGGGKHKGGKKKGKKMSTRVDLTPMVDLGFLLVTFFMLTTTFSKPQTMEIKWPAKDKDVKDQPKDKPAIKNSLALNVILGPDKKVYYYEGMFEPKSKPEVKVTDFSADGIRKVLFTEKRIKGDQLSVFIKALDGADYGNVVDILDEINITAVNMKLVFLVDVTADEKQLVTDSKL
jgi:biopolymer transport protein ExbD